MHQLATTYLIAGLFAGAALALLLRQLAERLARPAPPDPPFASLHRDDDAGASGSFECSFTFATPGQRRAAADLLRRVADAIVAGGPVQPGAGAGAWRAAGDTSDQTPTPPEAR